MVKQVEQMTFEFAKNKVIKGYPELIWTGKRPYNSTQYYPAQLKESYGESVNGWMNKIFWGDNLQVMSHMLKEYRGKINLIYIDPPYDSKADYKKKIKIKGNTIFNDNNSFEEKQYGDIWTNDEYLQFMYERLTILHELLSESGTIYLHCDWHKSHQLRMLLDEVFGPQNFRNEIIWCYTGVTPSPHAFQQKHDTIFRYTKSNVFTFTPQYIPYKGLHATNIVSHGSDKQADPEETKRLLERGKAVEDWWTDIYTTDRVRKEMLNYPTQKPTALLERIIKASSNPGDIVFDCFMGSGTTQAVSMKLGRRFIGADINLGAIQTTTKRLLGVVNELNRKIDDETKYTGFEVYNVNNYDFFRNPLEAKDLLLEALEVNKFAGSNVFDGEKDGRLVKVMPINRIATKVDLEGLVANLPYKTYEKRKEENPNEPVDKITLVCMGHEADLKAAFEQAVIRYKVDVEIVDILREKAELQLKREAEVSIRRDGDKIIIDNFYPLNLMQKLSLQREHVGDWKQLVESIMIDFNYDGAVLEPQIIDIPEKDGLVKGEYKIPEDAGVIRVKITDLLSESLEVEV